MPLQGLPLPVSLWESEVLPRRVRGYQPAQLDQLCASGEVVWVGAGLDRVADLLPRGRRRARRAGRRRRRPRARRTTGSARRSRASARVLVRPARRDRARGRDRAARAVGARLGGRGDERRLDAAPRRPPLRDAADASACGRAASRGSAAPTSRRRRVAGRSTARLFPGPPGRAARSPSCCSSGRGSSRATACAARESPAATAPSTASCATSRRSASAAAATSSRGSAARSSRCPARSSACASSVRRKATSPTRSCSQRPIRHSRTAPRFPWPKRAGARAARVAGAHVVLLGGEAALFVERGGRSLVPLREPDEAWLRPALAALVDHVKRGGAKRLAVERFDGTPVGETRGHAAAARGRLPRRPAPRRAPAVDTHAVPEGDALSRAARRLQVLVGERRAPSRRRIRARRSRTSRERLDGKRLESVEAVGKNLFLRFEGGVTLRSHLRMKGRWRVQERGREVVGKPVARAARRGARGRALARAGARAERPRAAAGSGRTSSPSRPTSTRCSRTCARCPRDSRLGEALQVQRAVAGIGNMWMSEALFEARVSPWLTLADATDDELARGARRGRPPHARPARRRARRHARLPAQAAGRARAAATPIRSWPLGDAARMAYWCPGCQRGEGPAAE